MLCAPTVASPQISMKSRTPRRKKSRQPTPRYLAWNALLAPFVPAIGAYTLWRRYVKKKSAASLRGQWGMVPREVVNALHADTSSTRIWLHAVSVGETMAARPLARALKKTIPNCVIALSVTTDTGYETAQSALKAGEVDGVFHFPLDIPLSVNRVLDLVQPHAFLTLETELWPNVLHLAHARGVKTFLVNGRVSDNLLRRAPQLGALWRWMMSNLDGLLMRSDFDAQRMLALGASREKVIVTGDVKLDAATVSSHELRAQWRQVLQIRDDALFFVAGSTHDGEEEIVLRVWQQLRDDFPTLRVLVAPRHIERLSEIEEICRRLDIAFARRSEISQNEISQSDVIILDSVGELSQIYAAADVAFVGGSLIKRGGHNVLEPVLCGVAVAFGPHVANFRAAAQWVEEADVGKMLRDEKELRDTLRQWLRDDAWRSGVAQRAEETLRVHQGASIRVAEIVAQSLDFI